MHNAHADLRLGSPHEESIDTFLLKPNENSLYYTLMMLRVFSGRFGLLASISGVLVQIATTEFPSGSLYVIENQIATVAALDKISDSFDNGGEMKHGKLNFMMSLHLCEQWDAKAADPMC